MKFSSRAERIDPFYVMEVAKAAQAMAREVAGTSEPMIFLNIGEPDFTAPPLVQEAAAKAVRDGATQYTNALGLDALRERISGWYQSRFGVDVPARPGLRQRSRSGGCRGSWGRAVLVPTTAAERYQLSSDKVQAAWTDKTRGVLLASPSNPTGTSIAPAELRRIHEVVQSRGGVTMIDEIYLGLSYEEEFGHTALAIDENIISINSFSKYFNMTGWRLGWMVVPDAMVPVVERLAQNLFICASTVSQQAALACFEAESIAEYERRRAEFKARRDYFIPALQSLGLSVPVMPDGAFYAWADCTDAAQRLGVQGSWDFALEVMRRAHVAITPGRDFGSFEPERFVRFSTANSMAQLQESVARLRKLLA